MDITRVDSVSAAPAYSGGERAAGNGGTGAAASAPAYQEGGAAKAAVEDAELGKLMEEPIRQANKVLQSYDRQIEREIHAVTKTLMYKIKDTKTNEVIAEYPPKKIQDMIAKMWELAGLFIDQKA